MKILVLPSWYPNDKNIISGIFVKEQVKAMKKVGIIPVVFFPYDSSIKKGKVIIKEEDGIKVYRANTEYLSNSKIAKLNSFLKIYPILKNIVKNEEVKLVHVHVCYTAGIMGYIFNVFNKKIPYVITEHRSNMRDFSSVFYNKIMLKLSYSNAIKVICVSKYLEDELKELGYKFNGKIIGNVIDTDKYNLKKNTNDRLVKRILFVGSMAENEVKGLQYFIPALGNYINNNSENIEVTFIGDGINRNKYQKMCKDLKIDKVCNFVGVIPKDDIPGYMEQNDILVLPSIKETFGTVIIEAMACGLPVLATKCGGPCEIINDKVGVLVLPKDVRELEEGLKYLIDNYTKFDPIYIRKYIVNNYSYEVIGNQLKELYKHIV